ncbi:acyl-CoA thioesterase [Halodurantibacterium flavum]|uniref:Acyl-CoA thioesterase n=1 Tax=Halodurantibacterium flavum TaxID=1382802 RepID=A0ABW4S8D4_9RHOB
MPAFRTRRIIEWGECDAAGIVFYPNYFRWMDATFHLLSQECGFDQNSLATEHDLLGTPLIEAKCQFLAPARFYDPLTIAARIDGLTRTSLTLLYAFAVDTVTVAEGREVRAFVAGKPPALQKADIPAAIRMELERFGDGQ